MANLILKRLYLRSSRLPRGIALMYIFFFYVIISLLWNRCNRYDSTAHVDYLSAGMDWTKKLLKVMFLKHPGYYHHVNSFSLRMLARFQLWGMKPWHAMCPTELREPARLEDLPSTHHSIPPVMVFFFSFVQSCFFLYKSNFSLNTHSFPKGHHAQQVRLINLSTHFACLTLNHMIIK